MGCRLLAHHLFHHPGKPDGVFDEKVKQSKSPDYRSLAGWKGNREHTSDTRIELHPLPLPCNSVSPGMSPWNATDLTSRIFPHGCQQQTRFLNAARYNSAVSAVGWGPNRRSG